MTTTEARQALIDKDPTNSYYVSETASYGISTLGLEPTLYTDYCISWFLKQSTTSCEQEMGKDLPALLSLVLSKL